MSLEERAVGCWPSNAQGVIAVHQLCPASRFPRVSSLVERPRYPMGIPAPCTQHSAVQIRAGGTSRYLAIPSATHQA